jgi:pimeloyl-ACP methyl ester carboxylesterase
VYGQARDVGQATIAYPAAAACEDLARRDFSADASRLRTRWCSNLRHARVTCAPAPVTRNRHRSSRPALRLRLTYQPVGVYATRCGLSLRHARSAGRRQTAADAFPGRMRQTLEYIDGQEKFRVGESELFVVRRSHGSRLLILHDELGYPGWMWWNDKLAESYELVIPLQPGAGITPRVPWTRSYRDVAGFYAQFLRQFGDEPVDVIGFSAGGFIAAEMAAACPHLFRSMILVAPMGIKPRQGEILDIMALSVRHHVAATVSNTKAEEFSEIYGGEITPEQFEAFEDARAETVRLGWEPFMHNPSLPYLLDGAGDLPSLIIWGRSDLVVPRGCIDAYAAALRNSRVVEIEDAGHRPEIESRDEFVEAVTKFLAEHTPKATTG